MNSVAALFEFDILNGSQVSLLWFCLRNSFILSWSKVEEHIIVNSVSWLYRVDIYSSAPFLSFCPIWLWRHNKMYRSSWANYSGSDDEGVKNIMLCRWTLHQPMPNSFLRFVLKYGNCTLYIASEKSGSRPSVHSCGHKFTTNIGKALKNYVLTMQEPLYSIIWMIKQLNNYTICCFKP